MPKAFDLYSFLYQHVFFFKYFKNLQFFLWMGILPLLCLLVTEFWRQLSEWRPQNLTQKIAGSVFLLIVLGAIAGAYFLWGHRELSTFLSLAAGLLLFPSLWHKIIHPKTGMILFSMIIMLQPLDVFLHLCRTLPHSLAPIIYEYDRPINLKDFRRPLPFSTKIGYDKTDKGNIPSPLYVTVTAFNQLYQNIPPKAIDVYTRHKFIIYDSVADLPPLPAGYLRLAKNFTGDEGIAYAENLPAGHNAEPPPGNPAPLFITENSESFQLLSADVNTVKIRTNFASRKFLVFTDNFHPGWRAIVNGKPVPIFKTNIAFKGIWLGPGENTILFRFGSTVDYVLNFILLISFYGIFLCLILPKKLTPFLNREGTAA